MDRHQWVKFLKFWIPFENVIFFRTEWNVDDTREALSYAESREEMSYQFEHYIWNERTA